MWHLTASCCVKASFDIKSYVPTVPPVSFLTHFIGGYVEGQVGPLDAGLAAPSGAPQLGGTHSSLALLIQLRQVRRRGVHCPKSNTNLAL